MKQNPDENSFLRLQAEELLRNSHAKPYDQLSEVEISVLLHELEVHQIELELQNQELVMARERANQVAKNYIDLYDFAPNGYFTVAPGGEIANSNIAGARMLGRERYLLHNKLFKLFLADPSKPIFTQFLEKLFRSNNQECCELTLKANENQPMLVYLTGIVEGNSGNCLITVTDLTERLRKEEELRQAKYKAEESDRLKSAFLSNMSHEIRTPMNGILGFADLLKLPGLSGDEQNDYIRMINQAGQRMLNTINEIIDISKIEAGEMKIAANTISLDVLLEYIYRLFKSEARNKGLQFSIHPTTQSDEMVVCTDREKLYAILTNLVKNALKFTERGKIEIGYDVVETVAEIAGSVPELVLQFWVRDTGIGIPQDRQKAIFERFIQADIADRKPMQGSGLGLSIAKAFVEMQGGIIWVESELGRGSTFYFTLPCRKITKMEVQPPVALPVAAAEIEVKKLKVLVVDDDEPSLALISIISRKFAKELIIAKTGLEAVEFCRQHPDLDLVLMDILLPELNGYEATGQIRKFNPEVIIIAQTSFALTGDREKALQAGCSDYISKPINSEELMTLIRRNFGKQEN